MKTHAKFVLILIGALLASCLVLSAQEEQKSRPEPKLTNWYKVDVALSEFEDGKKTNTRFYTLDVEGDGREAVLKLGDRVPVIVGAFYPEPADSKKPFVNTQFQYIDVGLTITSYIRERQGRLGVTVAVDQSSVTTPGANLNAAPDQPMIRQLKMENAAFVTLGKPILIASVDDPGKANHRYTVEATVTKLNP
jgi:hypothetical protein